MIKLRKKMKTNFTNGYILKLFANQFTFSLSFLFSQVDGHIGRAWCRQKREEG